MSQNKQAGIMPQVTFSTFIMSLGSAALVGLGEVPDPATGKKSCDLELARHNIDVLEMLRQKTEQGLNEDESSMLSSLIYELRLKYVMKRDA